MVTLGVACAHCYPAWDTSFFPLWQARGIAAMRMWGLQGGGPQLLWPVLITTALPGKLRQDF